LNAVIFDLFETLITEWGKPKYTTRKIAEELNIEYTDFRREWEALHNCRYLGELSGTTQVYKTIFNNLKITRDEQLLIEVTKKRDECKKACFSNIKPEIIEMLQSVKKKGYKIGLISNCSDEEITGLKDCELYNYIDAVVLSCDVGMMKPNINIYKHCASLLQVLPENCLYVGDGGSNELSGARIAKMTPLKAAWFIKHHVDNYNIENEYPLLNFPSDLITYLNGNNI
jgi:putative hydrolase of the HAD superfamily